MVSIFSDNSQDDEVLICEEVVKAKISKQWANLPHVPISHELVDDLPTTTYLANIVGSLWKATNERCGAPYGCRVERRDMYLCEACREYYHLICIGDHRRKPGEHIPYLCPMHPLGKQMATV
jgi:ABC-type antimicrobial peptide transport system ATPase subunit